MKARATDRSEEALQLFSPQLVGGEVARGFSGAPVVVGDRVVGLLRSAFERLPERVAAGTLYASSADRIAATLAGRLAGADVPMASTLRSALDLDRIDRRPEPRASHSRSRVPLASWTDTAADDALEVRVEISRETRHPGRSDHDRDPADR